MEGPGAGFYLEVLSVLTLLLEALARLLSYTLPYHHTMPQGPHYNNMAAVVQPAVCIGHATDNPLGYQRETLVARLI